MIFKRVRIYLGGKRSGWNWFGLKLIRVGIERGLVPQQQFKVFNWLIFKYWQTVLLIFATVAILITRLHVYLSEKDLFLWTILCKFRKKMLCTIFRLCCRESTINIIVWSLVGGNLNLDWSMIKVKCVTNFQTETQEQIFSD